MVPNEVPSSEIVDILIKDEVLVPNWSLFMRKLGIHGHELHDLQHRFRYSTKEVFFRALHIWISKSGKSATLQRLIEILRGSGYIDAAEKLEKLDPRGENPNAEEENIMGDTVVVTSPTRKSLSTTMREAPMRFWVLIIGAIVVYTAIGLALAYLYFLFFPQTLQELPEWHGMPHPSSHFIGRDNELQTLNGIFYDYQHSGELHAVLIRGPALTGKSELARHFATDLWRRSKVHIVWLNGTILESEVEGYLNKFGLRTNSSANEIFQAIRDRYKCQPWITIVDHVNSQKCINYLYSVYEKFRHFPPSCLPFVIITSSNAKTNFTVHDTIYKVRYITLDTYASLSTIISKHVTPRVISQLDDDDEDTLQVCLAIDNAFGLLEKNNIVSTNETRATISLLVLLSHFVVDSNAGKEFSLLQFWSSALKSTVEYSTLQGILECFVLSEVLVSHGTPGVGFFNRMIQPVIKDYYLKDPDINKVSKNLLGADINNQVSIDRWLMKMLIEYFKQPAYFQQEIGEKELHINTFMEKITNQKDLVREFKVQIINIWCCCWTREQLTYLQKLYEDLFGENDEITIDLRVELAWFHIKLECPIIK